MGSFAVFLDPARLVALAQVQHAGGEAVNFTDRWLIHAAMGLSQGLVPLLALGADGFRLTEAGRKVCAAIAGHTYASDRLVEFLGIEDDPESEAA